MKTPLIYGLLWALAGALLTFILFFLGFHSDVDKLKAAGPIGIVGGIIIAVVFIVLGTKARRAEIPASEPFTYGQALGAAMLVTLFAAIFGDIFNLIYTQYVNPGMQELMVQLQINKWEAAGMSSAQIENAEKMMRKFSNPVLQAAFYLGGGLIFGLIISLITSAFLKREASAPQSEAVPPPVAS